MKAESIVYAIAGMLFGVILGWVIAVQQGAARPAAAPAATAAAPAGAAEQAPPLDEARVQELTATLQKDPKNAGTAVQLADTYFAGGRYDDAIKWYEQALSIDPKNVEASTGLGTSYYSTGQTDRALQQFDVSLKIDPRHTKTLLNQGIVLAFGRQDFPKAAEAWKRVVEIAPNSPEGQAASRGLEGIAASGHPTGGTTPPAN